MNQPIPWNTKEEIHFAGKSTCTSGAKKLFLAPLKSYLELQQWSYSQKIWLLSYNAQLKIVVHCTSKVKKKKFILCSHGWLEYL